MELIIELDEKQFKDIQRIASIQIRRKSLTCEQIIANGTPLPKGHGRLIDADKLLDENIDTFMLQTETKIRIAPTIIEAEKEITNE